MGCAVGGYHFVAADNGRYLCFVLYTEGVEWVRGAKCVSMVCALCLLRFVAVECGRYGYAEGCEVSSDEFIICCEVVNTVLIFLVTIGDK